MDNQSLLAYPYSLSVMLIVLIMVFYQVYMVNRPQIKKLKEEHATLGIEGMCDDKHTIDVFGQGTRYDQELSDSMLSGPGYTKGFEKLTNGATNTTSGFLGGNEPPVFYDIGNVRAARAMRNKRDWSYNPNAVGSQDGVSVNKSGGYSIGQGIGGGVLTYNGNVVPTGYEGGRLSGDYYMDESGKMVPCAAGHRAASDGLSCIPGVEGYMGDIDPLVISTMQNGPTPAQIFDAKLVPY